MRRSIENAAHVGESSSSVGLWLAVAYIPTAGLFAPGGGQNPRHDQRRRRSQFDRGTRLAQMEEANGFVHQNMSTLTVYPVGPQQQFGPNHSMAHHHMAPINSAHLETHLESTAEEEDQEEANGNDNGTHTMGPQQPQH